MLIKNLLLTWAAVSLLALASSASAAVTIVDPDAGTALGNTIFTGSGAGSRTELVNGQITPGIDVPLTWSNPSSPSINFANAIFNFSSDRFSIFNINNSRIGGSIAEEHARIAFTVDLPTSVIVSGQYVNNNSADFSGRAALQNRLFERTGASVIPNDNIFSTSFLAGPNPLNIPTRTGLLLPGRVYVWDIFVQSLASGNPNAVSTANGQVSLAFAVVPEPTSLTIGLLMTGVGVLLRRRK